MTNAFNSTKMKKIIFLFISFLGIQANAQIIFQKTFGGADYEYGKAIIQTADTGFAIIGNTSSFGLTSDDVYLLKLNSNGSVVWSKTFGGTLDEEGNSMLQTANGDFIIAGATNSVANEKKVLLIRTNSTGTIIWNKVIAVSYEEKAYSIIETSTGDLVIGGYTTAGVYLLKMNSSGTLLWEKSYGNNNSNEICYQVIETSNGDYVMAGKSDSVTQNLFLLRTDLNGNLLWTKSYGSCIGMSVLQTADSGFLITGMTDNANTEIHVLKTDALGNVSWSKAYGGASSDYANSVIKNGSGGYLIAGSTYSFGGDDACLLNIDANGNIIWFNTYGIPGAAYGEGVVATFDNGFAFCGELGSDIFVVKTDSLGNSGCNQNNVVPAASNYPVALSGGAITQSGGNEFTLVVITGNPATVEATICFSTDISENISNEHISIYPNPASEKVFIEANGITRIALMDMQGRIIFSSMEFEYANGNRNYTLDLSKYSKGMYFVQVTTLAGITNRKLMVE